MMLCSLVSLSSLLKATFVCFGLRSVNKGALFWEKLPAVGTVTPNISVEMINRFFIDLYFFDSAHLKAVLHQIYRNSA